jgi:ribosomal protein S18 acetylase RimI-like enzyme
MWLQMGPQSSFEADNGIEIRAAESAQAVWLTDFLARHNSTRVASRGRLHYPAELAGFVAMRDGEPIGVLTYRVDGAECEIVTLHSDVENAGAGTALIERVTSDARAAGCRRLWLITTNDNTNALRFYQRRGFRIVTIHVRAVEEARRTLKPDIGLTGNDGILIRDEIEMEMDLDL